MKKNQRMYEMPEDGTWVLLKIVSATPGSRTQKTVVADGVQEKEIPHVSLELAHVSSAYGYRFTPYRVDVPVHDFVRTHLVPRDDRKGFMVRDATYLRLATGLAPGQEMSPRSLLGKNVMGRIHHAMIEIDEHVNGEKSKRFVKFDAVGSHFLPESGVKIPLTLRDGTTVEAQVTWNTVDFLKHDPVPGDKVNVISMELGKQITAVRVDDEWRDIHEV